MENLKIRVNSKAESKEVMSLLDTAGYTKGIIDNISKPCWIAVLDGKEYSDYMLSKSTWYTANPIEITIPELREMAYPVKEYLMPNRNHEYILTDAREALEPHAKDWIEIPEGAEVATICRDYIIFWKDEKYSFSVSEENKWCYKSCDDSRYFSLGEYMNEYGDVSIIWQREQDEPFLTPECTLNDQYAEIEQVRQAISKSWGSVGSASGGASQPSGGVDATLAERQSTYGNFEDVAFVTENIMSILAKVRVNGLDDLPNTHRMALYMIASKMARIVNGDFNHLDSWHDIGGYSKLIEKLIKGE